MDIVTISRIAMESMLSEVSATPKPGLVDRNNCGAHHDMDFFTFVASASSMYDAFHVMAHIGMNYSTEPVQSMWPDLQAAGLEMEHRMFHATKGVNTHKGMIFSLGILSACTGWLLGQPNVTADTICHTAAELCAGLCEQAFKGIETKENLTKGERMYVTYGFRGARGEAQDGFPTVTKVTLPMYRTLRNKNFSINDSLVETLLHLVAHTEDTNIISRHDWDTAHYAKEEAKRVLNKGGIHTAEGMAAIYALDQDFIDKYISPGGAADLLALTHFLYEIEQV